MLSFLVVVLRFLHILPGKRSLADLDPNTLRRERVKFEQAIRKLEDEIAGLEEEKDKLFKLGSTDVTDRERQRIARKIKQNDQLIASRDRNLALLNRNLHVVESLTQLLENQTLVKEFGLSKGVLAKLDIDEIRHYVDDATVEGQVSMERLAQLLAATDTANAVFDTEVEADASETELVELMRAAAQGEADAAAQPIDETLRSLAKSPNANGQRMSH